MKEVTDRQTFVISVNLFTFATVAGAETKSQVQLPMNLRFAAEEVIIKNITYGGAFTPNAAIQDISDIVQIWCNITNDGIIGSFPNVGNGVAKFPIYSSHNDYFRIVNTFQTGNFISQFPQTGTGNGAIGALNFPASYNPQSLISSLAVQSSFGVVVLTIEFVKYSK